LASTPRASYSLLYGGRVPTGRVMSPALAMLVQREAAIADFNPPVFAVKLETDPLAAKSERMDSLTEARALLECCNRAPYAVVQKIARRQRSEHPPLLYDLTTLQQDANRLFGFTAQQTLDYAQSLYEKQLLTYPRTDSRYLTSTCRRNCRNWLPACAVRYLSHPPWNCTRIPNGLWMTAKSATTPPLFQPPQCPLRSSASMP